MTKTTRRHSSPLLFVRATEGPVKPKRSRRYSISTIIIIVLAAIAAVAYYLGTPPPLPSAASTEYPCAPGDPQILIPQGVTISYLVPKLTVVLGVNNTVGWDDNDTTYYHIVASVSVPPNSIDWDFNMTAGKDYCVQLPTAGTYSYEIGFDPTTYQGIVIVKAS